MRDGEIGKPDAKGANTCLTQTPALRVLVSCQSLSRQHVRTRRGRNIRAITSNSSFFPARGHEFRWGAHALGHLIEIYTSPNGDHLWEVATAAASGAGSAESLGVARFFLSELEKMGRGDSRSGGGAGGAASKAAMRRRCAKTMVFLGGRARGRRLRSTSLGFMFSCEPLVDALWGRLQLSARPSAVELACAIWYVQGFLEGRVVSSREAGRRGLIVSKYSNILRHPCQRYKLSIPESLPPDIQLQTRLHPPCVHKYSFVSPTSCAGCRYLESAVKMMGRDKEGVDAAMAGFMSMLEDDKDSVPALLGMSLAFTLEDSPNKVRS